MARIKIEDLPKDMKISKEEMKNVVGGALISNERLGPFSVSASLPSKSPGENPLCATAGQEPFMIATVGQEPFMIRCA